MCSVTFSTTVLGGLPVSITAEIEPSDPSVGIFRRWVSDLDIRNSRGKRAGFIERHLTASERETLADEALVVYGDDVFEGGRAHRHAYGY